MARIRTVLASAVSWLVALAAVLTIVAEELAGVAGLPDAVGRAIATALVVIGVAVAIIRRVTPVLPGARGILPPPAGTPETPREAALLAQLDEARREFP